MPRPKSEDGDQRPGGQMTENGEQMTRPEDRKRKTENRGRRTEAGTQTRNP
jgi:hypothetical protein